MKERTYAHRGSAVGSGRAELQKERKNVPCRLCSSHLHCLVRMWLAHHHEQALLAALCNIVARPFLLLLNLIHPYEIHSIYLSLFHDSWDCNRWWECDTLKNSDSIISLVQETDNDALFLVHEVVSPQQTFIWETWTLLHNKYQNLGSCIHFVFIIFYLDLSLEGKQRPNNNSTYCINRWITLNTNNKNDFTINVFNLVDKGVKLRQFWRMIFCLYIASFFLI